MAAVRSRNTKPELRVRSVLRKEGVRYRLQDNRLPGKPDMTIPSIRLALFVHGCFWHRCPYCKNGAKGVGSNKGYWLPKLARNAERDKEVRARLRAMGWKVRVVWECQTKNAAKLHRIALALKFTPDSTRRR
jgi:DNA mismatch endonuclease (patch repair protein)